MIGIGASIFSGRNIGRLPDALKEYRSRVQADGGTMLSIRAATEAYLSAPDASLVYAASASKAGKAYSVLPAGGAGDFTVERPSEAFSIDADGKLVENDNHVPSYVYKDKRPYLAVREQMTNLFRDSEPDTDPGQGARNNVTFAANDWGIGDLGGKVVFEDNSLVRFYYNTNSLAAATYTMAFIIKTSSPPVFRHEVFVAGEADITTVIGNVNTGHTTKTKIEIFEDIYFCVVTGTSTVAQTNNGFRKETPFRDIPLEISAIMYVAGDVDISLQDYIKTTGTAETRDADEITVDLPAGVTKATLTDMDDVETVDNDPADPYQIPVGTWKNIIME